MRIFRRERGLVLAIITSVLTYLVLTVWAFGSTAWTFFGVDPFSPTFVDARVITSGWDCAREGYDVLAENPCDPVDRPMNYPRLWTLGSTMGLTEAATVPFAIVMIGIFYASFLFVVPKQSSLEAQVIFAFLAMSPATLLAVERGNIDLIVFALVVAGTLALVRAGTRALWMGIAALEAAAVLKLYPVFALATAVRMRDRPRLKLTIAVTLLFGLYATTTVSDLLLIAKGTPAAMNPAYGLGVLAVPVADAIRERVEMSAVAADLLEVVLSGAALGLLIGVSIALARRIRPVAPAVSSSRLLFVAGAGIYLGTFLLGSNWGYRLIFLVLCVPELLQWGRQGGAGAVVSQLALASVLVSHLVTHRFVLERADDSVVVLELVQVPNAALFCLLASLLWRSLAMGRTNQLPHALGEDLPRETETVRSDRLGGIASRVERP